jgi:hypothetical protein
MIKVSIRSSPTWLHQKKTRISRPITALYSVKSLNALNLNPFIMARPFSTGIIDGVIKNTNTDLSEECLRRNFWRRELEINSDSMKLKTKKTKFNSLKMSKN